MWQYKVEQSIGKVIKLEPGKFNIFSKYYSCAVDVGYGYKAREEGGNVVGKDSFS